MLEGLKWKVGGVSVWNYLSVALLVTVLLAAKKLSRLINQMWLSIFDHQPLLQLQTFMVIIYYMVLGGMRECCLLSVSLIDSLIGSMQQQCVAISKHQSNSLN